MQRASKGEGGQGLWASGGREMASGQTQRELSCTAGCVARRRKVEMAAEVVVGWLGGLH